jgi:hypothetical protein
MVIKCANPGRTDGMTKKPQTDYETYREIMDDLLKPIVSDGLDVDTVKRLYESKMVYLENLRVKCFRDINSGKQTHFTQNDYRIIVEAAVQTRKYLRGVVLGAINTRLENIRSA